VNRAAPRDCVPDRGRNSLLLLIGAHASMAMMSAPSSAL
jgi:hypothetical protein